MRFYLKYRTLHAALAFLLLFGQQVAFAHEAQHADDDSEILSASGGKHFHSGLCAFHSILDGVLGAVNSATVAPCVLPQAFEQTAELIPAFFSALTLIRGARDPPISVFS